jgi:parvulin-like peptidyl-prolyl isomerase
VSSYQQVLALLTASSAMQTDANASAVGWALPSDRAMVSSARQQTLQFFVSTLTLKAQLDKQHLAVTQKDIAIAIAALNAQVDNVRAQLKQTPGNERLRQLVDAATPDAIRLLAEQEAYTTVFLSKGQVPTTHAGAIFVKSQSDATSIMNQLQAGADFATLAKANSLDAQSAAKGGDLGTIYVGQVNATFDQAVFAAPSVARYVVIPLQGAVGVFEIVSKGQARLSEVGDPQTAQTFLDGWLTNVLTPKVAVENYVGD